MIWNFEVVEKRALVEDLSLSTCVVNQAQFPLCSCWHDIWAFLFHKKCCRRFSASKCDNLANCQA